MIACAAAAAIVSVAWRFLTFAGFNNDHYVHLARAYQMVRGDLPVRDFVDPGMPLTYVVSAAARTVLGPAPLTEWLVVATAFAIAAACTLVAAARLSRSLVIALVVTFLTIIANTRSYGYPKLLLYAIAAVAIIAVVRDPRGWRLFGLGAIAAAAFLFRHDHGLFIGVAALVAVAGSSLRDGTGAAVRNSLVFGGLVALLLTPWALFVQANGGLMAYFRAGVMFWRIEASQMTLGTPPEMDWTAIGTKGNAIAWLFGLFHLLPVACALLAAVRFKKDSEQWRGESIAVIAIAAMAVAVNIFFMRESLEARIPDAVVPAAVLGAWLVGLSLVPGRPPIRRAVAIACAVVAMAVTGGAVVRAANTGEQLQRAQVTDSVAAVERRAGEVLRILRQPIPEAANAPSRYSAALLPFLAYVKRCTGAGDRLMVTGLFPEVYVLADRGFAGGQIAFLPAFYEDDEEQALTIARLEQQSVPFVLLVEDVELNMPQLFAYLHSRYDVMTHVDVSGTRGVRVLVERNREARYTDPSTGWPCFQ